MSDGVDTDFSDLTRLLAEVGKVEAEAHANIHVAVEQTARAVQDGWKSRLYGSGHAKWTRSAITYDVIDGVDGVGAEIGPPRGRKQAGIVKLLELGSVNNPPHGGGAAALEQQADDFGVRLAFAIQAATRGIS